MPWEYRGDTHGAMKKKLSRFGGRNPEKFNFENLWKFVEIFHSLTQSLSDRRATYRGREPLRGRGLKINKIKYTEAACNVSAQIDLI